MNIDFDLPTADEIDKAAEILDNELKVKDTLTIANIVSKSIGTSDPIVATATGIMVGMQIAYTRFKAYKDESYATDVLGG